MFDDKPKDQAHSNITETKQYLAGEGMDQVVDETYVGGERCVAVGVAGEGRAAVVDVGCSI